MILMVDNYDSFTYNLVQLLMRLGVEVAVLRNDAESVNQHLDDTLWLRRAHSVGARRQLLNLITYAMGVNAMAMHVHRQGLAPPILA